MTTGILNTVQQLQMLHLTIDGVTTCPTVYPASISTAQLPLVIVWPGSGTTLPITARGQRLLTNREYSVRCYMEPFGQGNYDSAPRDAQSLIDRFIRTYFDNMTLADGYTRIESVRDSGIIAGTAALVGSSTLTFAGTFYKGFVFTLNIVEVI